MKKIILGLGVAVFVLGMIGVSANSVFAYRGDPSVKGPDYSAERHEAMTEAFENKDYDSWKNFMQGRGRVTKVVNKDNFPKFVEAHQLALQGRIDEAQKIRQELGLGLRNGSGKIAGGMDIGRNLNR